MPLPKALLEEMQRNRDAEARAAARDTRRDHVRTALTCLAWSIVGCALMGVAFHSESEAIGRTFFIGGQLVGYTGIVVTLVRAYLRGERRGDW